MPAVIIDGFAIFHCVYLTDVAFVSGTVKNIFVQLILIHNKSLLSGSIRTPEKKLSELKIVFKKKYNQNVFQHFSLRNTDNVSVALPS